MKILFISSKKRFDLFTGQYLRHYADVKFATASPADSMFFRQNRESPLEIHKKIHEFIPSDPVDQEEYHNFLSGIGGYVTASSPEERERIARIFLACSRLFQHHYRNCGTDICVVHERNFLDTAAAQHAAKQCGIRIYYFSSGFFRGKTISVAPERILFNDCEAWEKRLKNFDINAADKYKREPCNLEFHEAENIKLKKIPAWKMYITKLFQAATRNEHQISAVLRPRKNITSAIRNRLRKKRIRSMQPDSAKIPGKFILLPLQGNEILKEVPNPFEIRDMEHLSEIAIKAVDRMNAYYGHNYALVIKEHPLRPFIISDAFTSRYPNVIFLRKFNMDQLLNTTSLLLTFNSLAGFEALQKNKPVVTLGPLFYCLSNLVHKPENLEELPSTMNNALNRPPDPIKLEKLITYLKTVYEVNADKKNLNSMGLYNIACKILR